MYALFALLKLILADNLSIHSPVSYQVINEPAVHVNITVQRDGLYSISNITTTLLSLDNETLDCVFLNTIETTPTRFSYELQVNRDYMAINMMVKITTVGFDHIVTGETSHKEDFIPIVFNHYIRPNPQYTSTAKSAFKVLSDISSILYVLFMY